VLGASAGLRASQETFALGAALRDAVAQGRNGDRTCRIHIDGQTDAFSLRGPRAQFVIAVGNLVRNALQSVDRPVQVEITFVQSPKIAELHVDDDGPGVPRDLRERIFEPGFTRRPGGTGNGLSIVRDVFEREMEGKLSCDESPLGGARFRVALDTKRFGPQ